MEQKHSIMQNPTKPAKIVQITKNAVNQAHKK